MEIKRIDFDNIRQDVNKVKKYASDLQTFIGVNKMTSIVNGEVTKQKGAFNYDLFESPVYETSNGVPENRTISFSYFPLLENINNPFHCLSANTSFPSGNMSKPVIATGLLSRV
jgi:hypothetical protein